MDLLQSVDWLDRNKATWEIMDPLDAQVPMPYVSSRANDV